MISKKKNTDKDSYPEDARFISGVINYLNLLVLNKDRDMRTFVSGSTHPVDDAPLNYAMVEMTYLRTRL